MGGRDATPRRAKTTAVPAPDRLRQAAGTVTGGRGSVRAGPRTAEAGRSHGPRSDAPAMSLPVNDPTTDAPVAGLEIRLAGPDDAPALNRMITEFAAYERLPNHSTIESLRHELSRPDRVIEAVLATVGGEPVGMATFFQTYSTFAARRGLYLEDIYIREEWRNRSIATAILRFIARIALQRSYARVEFNILLWNNIAIEFFEKLGATPNSAWTTYRLSGEWLQRLANPQATAPAKR